MVRVRNVMLTNVSTLKKEARIEEAARVFSADENGCIVIEDGKPVGIVTELDLVRYFASKGKNLKEPISKIMTSQITYMAPDMKLDDAIEIIDTKKFRKYPVIENNKLVGIVTKRDIIIAVSDNLKLHRSIQNIVLILFVLIEFFVLILFNYFPAGA